MGKHGDWILCWASLTWEHPASILFISVLTIACPINWWSCLLLLRIFMDMMVVGMMHVDPVCHTLLLSSQLSAPQEYAGCLLFCCKSGLQSWQQWMRSAWVCLCASFSGGTQCSRAPLSWGQMESEDLGLLKEAVEAFFETALGPQVGFPSLPGTLSGNYNNTFFSAARERRQTNWKQNYRFYNNFDSTLGALSWMCNYFSGSWFYEIIYLLTYVFIYSQIGCLSLL